MQSLTTVLILTVLALMAALGIRTKFGSGNKKKHSLPMLFVSLLVLLALSGYSSATGRDPLHDLVVDKLVRNLWGETAKDRLLLDGDPEATSVEIAPNINENWRVSFIPAPGFGHMGDQVATKTTPFISFICLPFYGNMTVNFPSIWGAISQIEDAEVEDGKYYLRFEFDGEDSVTLPFSWEPGERNNAFIPFVLPDGSLDRAYTQGFDRVIQHIMHEERNFQISAFANERVWRSDQFIVHGAGKVWSSANSGREFDEVKPNISSKCREFSGAPRP